MPESCLLSQKTTNAEILNIFSGKTPGTRATIVTKCNVRFFEKIQENPPVAERQVLVLQNVTFYPTGTQLFLVFSSFSV